MSCLNVQVQQIGSILGKISLVSEGDRYPDTQGKQMERAESLLECHSEGGSLAISNSLRLLFT